MNANSSWHKKGLDSGPLRLWYSQATSGAVQIILTWGSGFRPFMFMIFTSYLRSNLVDPEKRVWIPALYIYDM